MNIYIYNDGSVVCDPAEVQTENLWIVLEAPETGDTMMIRDNIWHNTKGV